MQTGIYRYLHVWIADPQSVGTAIQDRLEHWLAILAPTVGAAVIRERQEETG